MKIFVHGKHYSSERITVVKSLIALMEKKGIELVVSELFTEETNGQVTDAENHSLNAPIPQDVDLIMTLGGDGTILDVAPQAAIEGKPVVGVNLGRLGFLADIQPEEMSTVLDQLLAGDYTLEPRSMLYLENDDSLFGRKPYALNEIAVHKRDSSSMITVDAYVEDKYLNTYWSDGLIISTPTGSTAYSMSAGGPILTPGCNNFVFAPIAPHNLNVRPLVVPDRFRIKLVTHTRDGKYLVSMDSRNEVIDGSTELVITRSPHDLQLVQLPHKSFLGTLREKLMWGKDLRSYDTTD